jgi:hypothetical protein
MSFTTIAMTKDTKERLDQTLADHADEIRALYHIPKIKRINYDVGIIYMIGKIEKSNPQANKSP